MGRMRLRIFTEPQQGAGYATLRRVAQATERLGFDAFFRSDHYLNMGEGSGLPGRTEAQGDERAGGRGERGLDPGWFGAEQAPSGVPSPPLADRFGMLSEQLAI